MVCGFPCKREEDEGHDLIDGRRVCSVCFELECGVCDYCGAECHEDDLEPFGDDTRLCPDCFAEEFPPIDEKKE